MPEIQSCWCQLMLSIPTSGSLRLVCGDGKIRIDGGLSKMSIGKAVGARGISWFVMRVGRGELLVVSSLKRSTSLDGAFNGEAHEGCHCT